MLLSYLHINNHVTFFSDTNKNIQQILRRLKIYDRLAETRESFRILQSIDVLEDIVFNRNVFCNRLRLIRTVTRHETFDFGDNRYRSVMSYRRR